MSYTFSSDSKVLYFIGTFSSDLLDQALFWLKEKKDRFIIAVEKTSEEMASTFENKELHERLFFYCSAEIFSDVEFTKYVWMSVFLKSECIFAKDEDENFIRDFEEKLKKEENRVYCSVSDWVDFGVSFARNCYLQCLSMNNYKKAGELKGMLTDSPAIVVGGAASTLESIEKLKGYENQFFILSGGTGCAKMAQGGVKAHLSAFIDPWAGVELLKKLHPVDQPFLFSLRTNAELMEQLLGEKLYFHERSGHLLEDYFFGDDSQVAKDSFWGWNVGNILAKWALEMGCNPVILVGMDMTYDDVEESLKPDEERVMVSDTELKRTRKDLLMGRDFFSELTKAYPSQKLLNAASKGLEIEHVEKVELHGALIKYQRAQDYGAILHQKMAGLKEETIDEPSLRIKLSEFHHSIIRAEEIVQNILQKMESLTKNGQSLENGIALEEVELEEEIVYQTILDPLWQRMSLVYLREKVYQKDTEFFLMKYLLMRKALSEHRRLIEDIMRENDASH